MGDADNDNHARMTDQEIQDWMDEVEAELEYGLNRMSLFVKGLNDQYAQILSVLDRWEKLRLCFTAANFFLCPVVLCIVMSYFSSGFLDSNSSIVDGLHTIVLILMFFSVFVGLPIYLFTLWNAYRADGKVEPKRTQSARWEAAEDEVTEDGHDNRSVFAEDSREMLADAVRSISRGMRDTFEQAIARRAAAHPPAQSPQVELTNGQAPIPSSNNGASESFDVEETPSEEVKLADTGSDLSDASMSEMLRRKLMFGGTQIDPPYHEVPLLILETVDEEPTSGPEGLPRSEASAAVEMERRYIESSSRSRQRWTTTSPRKGLRDIVVERIAEGNLVDGFLPPDSTSCRPTDIGSQ